jgi:cell division cycle protein 20 (cofactor of APC complex)
MKIVDRFYKTESLNVFSLESISKKILTKSKKSIYPSDHLLHFILKKPKKSHSLISKKKPNLFQSNSKTRSSFTPKSVDPRILVDQEEETIPLIGVSNDFYSHMVDSISSDLIAFGLFNQVVLYSLEKSCFIRILHPDSEDILGNVSSISVNPNKTDIIAVGNNKGAINLLDLNKASIFKIVNKHFLRVGSLKFHPMKEYLLASGSKECSVSVQDTRLGSNRPPIVSFDHKGEICGLSWQRSGHCLASGGNDNIIKIWDLRKQSKCLMKIKEHSAAIRALEFCPFNDNLLASGGGSGDSSIRITSLRDQGKDSMVIRTQSQICSLLWDMQCNRLLTSHGFSKYQLCLWNLEKENLVTEYYGHSNRILDIIRIKNSNLVLSFSPDNTAKVWNPFKAPLKSKNNLFTPIKLR